jgi:ATP-dependent DNA helicase PIF1
MVENEHLERMNICMKAAIAWEDWRSETGAPASGGVQVIVTGDFCQLPPLKPFEFCMQCGQEVTEDDHLAEFNCRENHGPFLETQRWAFKSAAWDEAKSIHVKLEEIHRQKDEYFIRMLQKCRLGAPFLPQEMTTLMEHPCDVRNATKLLCT